VTRSSFDGSEAFGLSDGLNAGDVLRLRAALQPQRGCSIQPSVGAKRLRWVANENENNSDLSGLGNRERNLSRIAGRRPQGPSERARASPRVVAAESEPRNTPNTRTGIRSGYFVYFAWFAVKSGRRNGCNPFSVENILGNVTQGSSFLATLGQWI
jgi:hypothetical protein